MSLPSTASSRSVVMKDGNVLHIEEVPHPYKADVRHPETYFRVHFEAPEKEDAARDKFCRIVADFLNGGPSGLRHRVTGSSAKIIAPLALQRHLASGTICITEPHNGASLQAYYFPYGGQCPYASIHYQVNADRFGIVKKQSPLVPAA